MQSRRILIPYKRYSAASIFLLLSLFVCPFSPSNRETRGRALFFYFKNERGEEGCSGGNEASGGEGEGDTLLIKTIDLSPGLRMHLEINTRGLARARARSNASTPGLKRVFPDDHLAYPPDTLDAYAFALFAIREKVPGFLTAEESEFGASI